MPVKSIMPKMIPGGYAKLDEMIKNEKNAKVKDRLRAIRWKFQKVLNAEIARRLNCTEQSVRKWVKNWNKQGYEGLLDKPKNGRPTILTKEEQEKIVEGVKKKDGNIRTTCKILTERIKEKFNKKITIEPVRKMLHKNKISWKKPDKKDYRRNEETRETFMKDFEKNNLQYG